MKLFKDHRDVVYDTNGALSKICNLAISHNHYKTVVGYAIVNFLESTVERDFHYANDRYAYARYLEACDMIKHRKTSWSRTETGNLNDMTMVCLWLIEDDWMTKDEVLDMLKPWPYTDTLVEVIRYDKPLCANRWEI